MKPWQQVRRKLDSVPVTEGFVGGVAPDASALYMEHYLLRGIEKTVPGISQPVFVTHFGGARVREGESGAWRSRSLPSQSLLVPAHCATHWHYSGTVDFAVFYFPDRTAVICERVKRLAAQSKGPVQFADALVSTLALQMVKEFHKGPGKDERFITMLTPVMLEQVYRVLTTPGTTGFNPRHIHFARLQTVLAYIRDHLGENLSVPMLAQKAEVSVAHFRRLFLDAMGTSPARLHYRNPTGESTHPARHHVASYYQHRRGVRLQQPEPLSRQFSHSPCQPAGRVPHPPATTVFAIGVVSEINPTLHSAIAAVHHQQSGISQCKNRCDHSL